MAPVATPESKPLQCTSIYALSKKDQEEMTLLFGRTYNVPVVALRYFNIYGTRQSLSNPYTGVAAIFASRLLNRNTPMIFEDGRQQRDFVSVHDVVQANLLAMERSEADGMALNIGFGRSGNHRGRSPRLVRGHGHRGSGGDYRKISRRRHSPLLCRYLGGAPAVGLSAEIPVSARECGSWLPGCAEQTAVDKVQQAAQELDRYGLTA